MNIVQILSVAAFVGLASANPIDFVARTVQDASDEFYGNQWAILVAGQAGYENYRHQANVYHAYQMLRTHGVPDERIVVMHPDDIANSSLNPFPGNVINRPGGPNVYLNVPKDFTGEDVTAYNFMLALRGDLSLVKQGRKVINSTKNDHVFVYISSDGSPGALKFPSLTYEDYLLPRQLNEELERMNAGKQFEKLVFYLDSSYSGELFYELPVNINVYATTSANPYETSAAFYYDKARKTYLGTEYSIRWIEDSEARMSCGETLQRQFDLVQYQMNGSHAEQYGNLLIANLPLSDFHGNGLAESSRC